MMIDLTIIRMLHIVFGVLWVGMGFVMVVVFNPFATSGDQTNRLMMRWYAESSFNKFMPIAAIITTVAGLYITGRLYIINGGGWLSNTGMGVLNLGMLFGLLAFGHGIALGVIASKYAKLSREVLATAGGVATNQQAELDNLEGRLMRSGRISLVLTTIALIAMSSARYLPAVG